MDEAEQISLPSADADTNGASAPVNSATFGLGPHEALEYRKKLRGMIGVASKVPLKDRSVLSLVYTPGVAEPCREIAKNPLAATPSRWSLMARRRLALATSVHWRRCPCWRTRVFSSRHLAGWMPFPSAWILRTSRSLSRQAWRCAQPLVVSVSPVSRLPAVLRSPII